MLLICSPNINLRITYHAVNILFLWMRIYLLNQRLFMKRGRYIVNDEILGYIDNNSNISFINEAFANYTPY
jgi:hypothetical protein